MTAGEATREYYREQGRKQERERIIALINTLDITIEEAPDGAKWIVGDALDLIDLIHGETK